MKHEQFEKPYYKTCLVTCLKPNDKIFAKTNAYCSTYTKLSMYGELKYIYHSIHEIIEITYFCATVYD